MRIRTVITIVLLVLSVTVLVTAQQGGGAAALAQARAKKGAGDLQGAIRGFERVATEITADRNAVANALLELGGIYEFLGEDARAIDWYERVIEEYADQRAERTAAAGHLAEIAARKKPRPPLKIKTPFTEDPFSFALSPDGRTLVIQATTAEGRSQLWRQPVDPSKTPEPIPGTEGAGVNALPFFSPDGRAIGYFAKGKLWTIDLRGGAPREIADAPVPGGGTWNRNGVLVFTGSGARGPIQSVKDGRIVTVPAPTGFYVFPVFMDDSRFLYFKRDSLGYGKIEIGSLAGGTPLAASGVPDAQFGTFSSGHLLYLANRRLMAQKFDPQAAASSGRAFVVAEPVGREARIPGSATVSASLAGPIAYREEAVVARRFTWINRDGVQTGTLGALDPASPGAARISPDGRMVAFFRQTGYPIGTVWAMDTTTGAIRVLRESSYRVVFSPDGRHTTFGTTENGDRVIYDSEAGTGRILPRPRGAVPEDWSRNGILLYRTLNGPGDLFAFALNRTEPVVVAATAAAERNGRFSPDGNWIAYQSDESGRNEVYVQPFPGTIASRHKVSLNGGTSPQWARGGKELYFLSPDHRVVNAPVHFSSDNRTIEFGTPAPLFQKPLRQGSEFEAAADGDRFLVIEPVEDAPPIYVLSNWLPKK